MIQTLTEFKEQIEVELLLFDFHPHFKGLFGMDILRRLKAKIDLHRFCLETPKSCLKICTQDNPVTEVHVIPAQSKILVNLPVKLKQGDFYNQQTTYNEHLEISEGLYNSANGHSNMLIINKSLEDQQLYLEQPLEIIPYNQNHFVEINNITSDNGSLQHIDKHVSTLKTDHLNSEEKKALMQLCSKYTDIFYDDSQKLTFTSDIKHYIRTTDDKPIFVKSYRYPFALKKEVKEQIESMLSQNIIRTSYSPWSAPVWVVPKKTNRNESQKWRLVLDYRKLNEKTISDRYPIPNINDILDQLGKSIYFSTLDLASGFHQIEMNQADRNKTAFTVEGGHFEFVRMPFGLKNAPATFQRVMDFILGDLIGSTCLVYLDDIIIFSTSLQNHLTDIRQVFERLRSANFKLQVSKSDFLRREVNFLGHIVTQDGVKPNPNKIKSIQEFPIPKNRKQIKSFLGLLGYYRKFIKDFARITKPLTQQLKGTKAVTIDEEYCKAFEFCKTLLCNSPILIYPNFNDTFILTTDASNYAIGAVLSQKLSGSDKPISYASRTLSDEEIRYSVTEKEMLAVHWAVKHFRPYLFGKKFILVSDHKPLTWNTGPFSTNDKVARWKLQLLEYEYEFQYKKGSQNVVADALSRSRPEVDIEVNNIDAGNSNNLATSIPTVEKPLNEFNWQIVLAEGIPASCKASTPFKNKLRRTITEPSFTTDIVLDVLKKTLKPNKTCTIYASDNIFKIVQDVFSEHFLHKKLFKLLRCATLLKDITNPTDQEKIVNDYHNNSNHRGIDETLMHLKRTVYFPYMKNKIAQIIKNCEVCLTLKYDRQPQKPPLEVPETPCKPMDIIHIDIYTINNNYNLTLIDKFSKFACAYPIPNRTCINVVTSMKQFFSLFGIPKKLIHDQGAEFSGSIFKDFCNQYDIQCHITSFQQSSSNSPVERLHSTLTETYRIIAELKRKNKQTNKHEETLSETLLTYNNAIHSSTKYTPFELFTGRTHIFEQTIKYDNNHEYLQKLNFFQSKLYQEVKEMLHTNTKNNLDKLNKHRKSAASVSTNDSIFRKENRRNKLTPRFSKHKVLQDNGNTLITTRSQKIHKSKIRRTT